MRSTVRSARRLLIGVALVGLAVLATPGPAHAGDAKVSINPSVVQPGGSVTVYADCFNSTIQTLTVTDPLKLTEAGTGSGAFTTTLPVPATAAPTSVSAEVVCADGSEAKSTVRIALNPSKAPAAGGGGAADGPAGGQLPLAASGLALLLVVGVAVALVARRRRRTRN